MKSGKSIMLLCGSVQGMQGMTAWQAVIDVGQNPFSETRGASRISVFKLPVLKNITVHLFREIHALGTAVSGAGPVSKPTGVSIEKCVNIRTVINNKQSPHPSCQSRSGFAAKCRLFTAEAYG